MNNEQAEHNNQQSQPALDSCCIATESQPIPDSCYFTNQSQSIPDSDNITNPNQPLISSYYITNQNDMYLFFEVIEQVEPVSILDIGMFLKRIGAISRTTKDMEISYDIRLDAIDIAPRITAGVYSRIYDDIWDFQTYKKSILTGKDICDRTYDIAYMLRIEQFLDEATKHILLRWLSTHVTYVVISGSLDTWGINAEMLKSDDIYITERDLHIDDDTYNILTFG